MTTLSWDSDGLGQHRAWSGQINVGAVFLQPGGRFWFDATYAVRMRDVSGTAPSCGKAETLEEAKFSLERAWVTWLELAGLQ